MTRRTQSRRPSIQYSVFTVFRGTGRENCKCKDVQIAARSRNICSYVVEPSKTDERTLENAFEAR
jgi:hypothetical protein